jgi:hypothetical protein
MIYTDVSDDGNFDAEDTLLEVHEAYTGVRIAEDGTGGAIRFSSRGVKTGGQVDLIVVCDADGSSGVGGKALSVSPTGAAGITEDEPDC